MNCQCRNPGLGVLGANELEEQELKLPESGSVGLGPERSAACPLPALNVSAAGFRHRNASVELVNSSQIDWLMCFLTL